MNITEMVDAKPMTEAIAQATIGATKAVVQAIAEAGTEAEWQGN